VTKLYVILKEESKGILTIIQKENKW
jgi:hypothetical protein